MLFVADYNSWHYQDNVTYLKQNNVTHWWCMHNAYARNCQSVSLSGIQLSLILYDQ